MKTKVILFVLAIAMTLCSCGGKDSKKKSYDKIGLDGLTERTENLRDNLQPFVSKGVLIGQVYGTLEGIGWQGDSARSDIYEICHDYPAVVGYRLDGIENGGDKNADGLSFAGIRTNLVDYFHRNGLILASWAMPEQTNNDEQLELWAQQVARFLDSLQDTLGIKAPVVLFINPLRAGAWYGQLPKDDYTDLYEKFVDKLKDKDVQNAIYGYSEEWNGQQWRGEYPDDISVINLTCLQGKDNVDMAKYVASLSSLLPQLTADAQSNNAVVGLTTGIESLPDATYFSDKLLPLLKANHLSYVMFGANYGDFKDGHFFVPYPGIDNEKIHDFTSFYNDPATIFLRNLNGLYLKH